MEKTILKYAEESSEKIISKIVEDVERFSKDGDLKKYNGNYADDITMIVFKREKE